MCSIIKLKGRAGAIKDRIIPYIKEMIDIKGGDEYNIVIKNHRSLIKYITNEQLQSDFTKNFKEIFHSSMQDSGDQMSVLIFSRLTPEMEIECGENLSQPYFNYNSSDKNIVAVHGTIPNAEEIAKKYNFKINVDTEIFYHLPFWKAVEETEKVGGKITAISLDDDSCYYHNGLGLFQYTTANGDIIMTTNLDLSNINFKQASVQDLTITNKKIFNMGIDKERFPRIISLFSGGLDITCSTQAIINKYQNIKSINLWYFDWGTRARDGEVQAGKDFCNYLNDKLFPESDEIEEYFTDYVTHTVLPVKKAFKNILKVCDLEGTRLTDDEASGAGSHEAESAISYVPYRNTILLTMAAARAEQLYPGERCIFVIGANLSEGMIYLDNSEPFITAMNTLVKLGGQKSMYFEVQAPYVNRTKTAMIKDAKLRNFKLDAFSCYFPVNGKECEICGSCLLKQNALLRG